MTDKPSKTSRSEATASREVALGLSGVTLGDEVAVRLDATGAQGFSGTTAAWGGIPAEDIAAMEMARLNLPVLNGTGFALSTTPGAPNAWHLSADDIPTALVNETVAPKSDALFADEDDAASLHFDLRAAKDFAFHLPNGQGLLIEVKAGQPFVRILARRPAPVLEVHPPLADWLAQSGDEAWLMACDASDGWSVVCAAGRIARLREVLRDRGAEQRLNAAFGAFAQSLSEDSVDAACDLATRAALDVRREMAATLRQVMPDSSEWSAQLGRTLHLRDDLESAYLVLDRSEANGAQFQGVTASRRLLDEEGRDFIYRVPHPAALRDDEQLYRVWRDDPLAWWALPAAPDAALESGE